MSRYLLDTTVLIAQLRGDSAVSDLLLTLLRQGHSLCTSCVNIAEVERGVQPKERKTAEDLLDRLEFLPTTKQAALRAGRYQREWQRRGRMIHLADALVAGTARANGAVLLTDNTNDFPMRDMRVRRPP